MFSDKKSPPARMTEPESTEEEKLSPPFPETAIGIDI
ncbi:hypothetical protein A2U01_0033807, partial [Trifolium medium]|nr:hypothetical protein [Trifolium medium]MCI12700.1 hypothetical protein [Trifolium medium]